MRIDGRLAGDLSADIVDAARQQERDGYGTLWSSETAHDPFLPLAVAAGSTDTVGLGCAIAVAFARNPMTTAHTARDLQKLTGGRFTLGLGTQVRAHITRRFSMPWSDPVPRIEEFVLAVRTIISAWEQRTPLRFGGRYYRHDLMTPFFSPEPTGLPMPRVVLAAVGPRMARAAGRVADGVLTHAFTTPRYLVERLAPAVREGRDAGEHPAAPFEMNCRVFVVTGRDERELAAAAAATRAQIAFYGSTPAYRPVLELHGWSELADRLHALSVSGEGPDRWARMAELIDDEVLTAFAAVGEPARIAPMIVDRYAGIADACRYYTPYRVHPGVLNELTRAVLAEQRARTTHEEESSVH